MKTISTLPRRRARRLLVAAACAPVALATGGYLAGAAAPASAATSVPVSAIGIRGQVRLVGTTSPARAAAAPGTRAARPGGRVMPLLRPVHRHPSAAQHGSSPVPRAASTATTAKRAGLVTSFDGLDALQNKAAAGFDLEPPDEGLGAGNGYVTNFVNLVGEVYRTSGASVTPPFYLNTFFRESAAAFTSDPRVYYDPASRTWFATILEATMNSGGNITESHVDLAVSTSGNPAGTWRVYRIPTSNPAHAGCPCLPDYPILGVDRTNVYISTNEFTSTLTGFNGAQLYALSKPQLVAGRTSVNTATFPDLAAGGAPAYHVQPANTTDAAPAEFALSSLDPNSTFDNRLAVWAVSNERSLTTGHGSPSLSMRVIDSEGYAFPSNAQTPPGFCGGSLCPGGAPTTGVVQTDFDAMQETQYIHGRLVGALNTGITVPGDTTERSGVAWFVLKPTVRNGTLHATTRILRQGYLSTNGQYLLYPHLNMTQDGSMALVVGLGGPATYLSAAYAIAPPRRGFGAIHLAAAGTGPDNGFTGTAKYGGAGRWGDYSNGQIVPGTNRVWLATQYIPNTGDGNANWGNAIFELRLP